MRDKLIDLIQNAVGGCARHWAELIADNLIANDVTIKPMLTVAEKADLDRICKDMLWKCTEMCQPGMWESYTRHMECGEIREFAQYYKDVELLYKVLTGHEMFAPSLGDKS
jgi:hypothetical protein